MVYHFVKHVGFDIKADSLEQAKEIAEAIDDTNNIEDVAYDTMFDAIDDVLDVGVLRDEFYDTCDAHAGETEYVGCTDDEDDPEKRLFDYLTDADEDNDEDATYRLTDKGRDYLDFLEGKYLQFNVNDYDRYGNRLLPRRDGSAEDAIARFLVRVLLEP